MPVKLYLPLKTHPLITGLLGLHSHLLKPCNQYLRIQLYHIVISANQIGAMQLFMAFPIDPESITYTQG